MKKRFVAVLLTAGLGFCAISAQAQNAAPDFPTGDQPTASAEAPAKRPNPRATAEELRRAAMTPEEQQKEQQLNLLAARTGNTSFSKGGPTQQYDSRSGGFMVRKYKSRTRAGKQHRGMTHTAGFSEPRGERLIDKKHKKKFLLF
jgi:hypothetical protein